MEYAQLTDFKHSFHLNSSHNEILAIMMHANAL